MNINVIKTKIVEYYKKYFNKEYFEKNKYFIYYKISILSLIFILFLIIFYLIKVILLYFELNKKTDDLKKFKELGINIQYENIEDFLKDYVSLIEKKDSLEKKLNKYQYVFNNFLIDYYLPSLNIWKDWTWYKILYWEEYIKNNPFIDTNLIFYWTNFFKDIWEWFLENKVKDIKIWKIVEEGDLFYIPIDVSIELPSRKNFLWILYKLWIVSDKLNIILINEFFYYLTQNYNNLEDGVKTLKEFMKTGKWISKENLEYAIRKVAWCDKLDNLCYYKFRDKFRKNPYFAYLIWREELSYEQKINFLRDYLRNIPWIIKIENFTFAKLDNIDVIWWDMYYNVNITFKLYWRNLTNSDLEDISNYLWKKCIWKKLTKDETIDIINNKIKSLSNNVDAKYLYQLQILLKYLNNIAEKKINYEKALDLFEYYRILKDNNLCIKN